MKAKAIAKAYIAKKFNGAEAGLAVFNTTNRKNAANMTKQALKLPIVQSSIQEELAESGLTKEYLNRTMYEAIEINKQGKPSQAVLAQLIIQGQKVYDYMPKDSKEVVKQERKILLDKDFNVLKDELTQTITTTQQLLNDLD